MIVYFDPSASDSEVADALSSIESIEGVEEAEAVTHDETFAEFREIFAENTQLIETVTADILPPSIRVRVDERSTLDDVETHAMTLSKFREVLRGAEALSPAVTEQMGADQLERWCSGGG